MHVRVDTPVEARVRGIPQLGLLDTVHGWRELAGVTFQGLPWS